MLTWAWDGPQRGRLLKSIAMNGTTSSNVVNLCLTSGYEREGTYRSTWNLTTAERKGQREAQLSHQEPSEALSGVAPSPSLSLLGGRSELAQERTSFGEKGVLGFPPRVEARKAASSDPNG